MKSGELAVLDAKIAGRAGASEKGIAP